MSAATAMKRTPVTPVFRAEELELDGPVPGAGEGVIERLTRSGARVRVGARTLEASFTTAGTRARAGDRVLVLESADTAWIVGAMSAPTATRQTSDGVSASVRDDVLLVRGAEGELLFSHDARTGRSQLVSRALTIQAESVSIGGRDVSVSADQRLAMSVGGQKLELTPTETRIEGQRLTTKLEEGRFSIQEIVLSANKIEAGAKALRQIYDRVERRAEQVVERTRDSFREVEGVDETHSGQIRFFAQKAFSLLTQTGSLRAEQGLSVHAEKIELG